MRRGDFLRLDVGAELRSGGVEARYELDGASVLLRFFYLRGRDLRDAGAFNPVDRNVGAEEDFREYRDLYRRVPALYVAGRVRLGVAERLRLSAIFVSMKFVVPLSIPSSLTTEQPATPFFIMSMSGVPLITTPS